MGIKTQGSKQLHVIPCHGTGYNELKLDFVPKVVYISLGSFYLCCTSINSGMKALHIVMIGHCHDVLDLSYDIQLENEL